MLDHYWSVFFFFGLLVVTAFAWKRFNEPSFPNQESLPRAVDPLRYLFFKSAYQKARLTYLVALLLLYVPPRVGRCWRRSFSPAWGSRPIR